VLADIGAHLNEVTNESSENRFFLLQAACHIRRRLLLELQQSPDELASELKPRLWRAGSELVLEAREAFANSVGLAELIDWFRVFVSDIARVLAEALRKQKEGISKSAFRLLSGLQKFALSAFNNAVTQAELDFLEETSRGLRNVDSDIAELLEFFVMRVHDEGNRAIHTYYCQYQVVQEKCPVCLQEGRVFQWSIINIKDRPDLAALVRSGKAVIPACRLCGSDLKRQFPLLYCDPAANQYLLLCPQQDEAGEEKLNSATFKYFEHLPLEYRDNRPRILITSDYFGTEWKNDEQHVIVSRVRNQLDFSKIVNSTS
jgi:hypothetical protein